MSITSKGDLVTDYQYQNPSHHVPTSNPPESHVRPSIVAAEQSDSIDIISKLGTICLYSRMLYPMGDWIRLISFRKLTKKTHSIEWLN